MYVTYEERIEKYTQEHILKYIKEKRKIHWLKLIVKIIK